MDPKTTALVLIEFQNDFTSEGGTLHGAVAEVMESTKTVEHAQEAVGAAHAAGATVIHSPISFQPGYYEITQHPYGILKGVVDSTSFVKGTWGCEIDDRMAPAEGDIVLEGKRGLDAFASTNLDFILRSKGIRTVVLAGFLTNCCVESTMRSAYEKGFEVYTLTDAVGATSQAEHANAITYDYPMFSKPIATADFVAAMSGDAVSADTSRGY
ncbi:MAG: cysteine hydrolase [Actinobacteria bacterium]|uniref:cysteine hydrolase n=1 Tax=Propionicimonas sp. T2.31MG-18 TaxID=3157620 RepID=UPI0035E9AF54|nr:cysteine hydrolase [Actinomycetota bacterium]